MSEIIVIGYDDQATATQAYNEVITLQKDFIVELTGLAIVRVDAEGNGARRESLQVDAERRPDGDGKTLRRHPPVRQGSGQASGGGQAAAVRGGLRFGSGRARHARPESVEKALLCPKPLAAVGSYRPVRRSSRKLA